MTLLDSLLDAIVRLEGDALVMHVGEKPYVVTTSTSMNAYRGPLAWGQVELSSRVLTPDAVLSMVGQILPADQRNALEELGAVEHEIASPTGVADRFSVVAARGGDDIWLELRRHAAAPEEGAVEIEQPPGDGSTATEPAAAAAATGPSVSTAVGLQEPPGDTGDIAGWSGVERGGAQTEESVQPREEEDTAVTQAPGVPEEVDGSAIEERAAVLAEITQDVAEHLEHIFVPLAHPDDTAAPDLHEDAALELVEPEMQHVPSEEDVDALLAATAASMLSANATTDPPDALNAELWQRSGSAGTDAPDTFEVVIEDDEEQVSVVAAEPGTHSDGDSYSDLDLTAALDEMPAAPWVPPTSPETSSLPMDAASAPPDSSEAQSPAEAAVVPPRRDVSEPVPTPPAAPAVTERPHPPREPQGIAVPHAPVEEVRDEQPSFPPEISVDKPAARPVTGSPAPAHVAPKIAAGAHQAPPSRVVVPIGRATGKPERPDAGGRVDDEALLQMLRVAAERGASTVYVVAQSKPMIRVDGEISALEEGPALTAADIERLVSTLAPPRPAGTAAEAGAEWMSEVPQVGRVRCVTFRDHRGPGLIFRLISPRLISADHLNLSPEIRELGTLADGLVIVAGARAGGKSTLLNSFVDLVNRTRSDHVITVETEIAFVHESQRSFISQREVHDGNAAAAAVSAAMREDPDVLVIEDLQSPETVMLALQAAESGRLVFASINAPSAASAVEALVNMIPDAERASVRATLAGVLRAIVAQLLLRKASGGRVAARELLLNSAAVSASIRDGSATGVTAALESGQRQGMVPLTDSLAGLVRGGIVHGAEACRRSPDRKALLAALTREGVDTSFAERLA